MARPNSFLRLSRSLYKVKAMTAEIKGTAAYRVCEIVAVVYLIPKINKVIFTVAKADTKMSLFIFDFGNRACFSLNQRTGNKTSEASMNRTKVKPSGSIDWRPTLETAPIPPPITAKKRIKPSVI